MARQILKYLLDGTAPVQAIEMPRRARVISVCWDRVAPALFAELVVDADTKAFEVRHMRYFAIVHSGGTVPEAAGYIGSCVSRPGPRLVDHHIYEVRSPHTPINPRGS